MLLQAFLERRAGASLGVEIAGTWAGEPQVDATTVEVLQAAGVAPSGRPQHRLAAEVVAKADLVLCLERPDVRDVAVADRHALARTFTVRELVRRGERVGPRLVGETLDAWLERVHAGRDPAELLQDAPDDDVADPTGGSRAAYEHTARWLDGLAERLIRLAFPPSADDADAAVDSLPRTAFAGTDRPPELEVWRREQSGDARPATVGMGADRAGVRLARGIEAVLQALGYDLFDLHRDAWVAPTWTTCASESAAAVARGDVDVVVLLTDSGTGPAALANRQRGVRAVAATDVSSAKRSRRSWGANVLCLGVDEVTPAEAVDIVMAFLNQAPGSMPELDDGVGPAQIEPNVPSTAE